MSDENNMDKAAAAAAIAVVAAEPKGPWAQTVKGVQVAFATKKAAMAAWALFAGVSAVTAGYSMSGMTSAELQTQQVMQETIATLTERTVELETKIIKLQTVHTDDHAHKIPDHEHENDTAVIPVVIPGPKGDKGDPGKDGKDAVLGEHDHMDIRELTGVFGHDHETVPAHKHEQKACPVIEVIKKHEHTLEPYCNF